MSLLRVAAMVSGSGSTAHYLLQQTRPGGLLHGVVEIGCLIASESGIGAIDKFANDNFGGNIYVCNPKEAGDQFGHRLVGIIIQEEVDLFGQYGWLPMTPEELINYCLGTNQHPAAVPWFGGQGMYSRAPHAAVLNFARAINRTIVTVATAQVVDKEYDKGRILLEVPLAVNPQWSVEQLQTALLPLEWQCQAYALLRIAAYSGKVPPAVNSSFRLLPGEEEILAQAKADAIATYPHG